MKSLLREPLLGFALAGGLVFLLYSLVAEPEQDAIVVTPELVGGMDDDFLLRNGRRPTPQERDTLIQRYIDEEILVRAAYAEGLDRRDGRVRQQLIKKMTFLIDEEPPDPTDTDLQQLYDADPSVYFRPSVIDVLQLALDDSVGSADVRQALENGKSGEAFGKVTRVHALSEVELGRVIGPQAAAELMQARVSSWHGPFTTPAGRLLVQVTERQPASRYGDEQLASYLREDWLIKQRQDMRRVKLDAMKEQYRIDIQLPADRTRVAAK